MPAIPGVEPPVQALCVAPFGMEEGTQSVTCLTWNSAWSWANRCTCAFFGSSVRRQDAAWHHA
jgi:hypothetical protein